MALYFKKGTYTGSGSDGGSANISGFGFQPKFVWIFSLSTDTTYEGRNNPYFHSDTALGIIGGGIFRMGDNSAGWINSRDIISGMTTDGFTEAYTATAAYKWLHFSGQVYPYVGIGGTDVVTGGYVGNGADNRNITGIGFEPAFVMVWGLTGTPHPFIRFSTNVGDQSASMNTAAAVTNRIQGFHADGFQLGNIGDINNNGTQMYYMAIKAGPQVRVGSYTGDGLDNRNISMNSPTFTPDFLIIKSRSGTIGVGGAALTTGDAAKGYLSVGYLADYIQSCVPGSFQVGTSLNGAGQVYDYIAMSERVGPTSMARIDGSVSSETASIDFVSLDQIDSINTVT